MKSFQDLLSLLLYLFSYLVIVCWLYISLCCCHCHERSYNENSTPSRPLWEVKSHLAWSVVRWVTTCEARVLFVLSHSFALQLFFLYYIILSLFLISLIYFIDCSHLFFISFSCLFSFSLCGNRTHTPLFPDRCWSVVCPSVRWLEREQSWSERGNEIHKDLRHGLTIPSHYINKQHSSSYPLSQEREGDEMISLTSSFLLFHSLWQSLLNISSDTSHTWGFRETQDSYT